MDRAKWVRWGLVAATLLAPLAACTNNPFNPRAELLIESVKSDDKAASIAGFVGIAQNFTDDKITYQYSEPVVTIRNGPNMPEVRFTEAIVAATINRIDLPRRRVPLVIFVPRGGSYSGAVPILSVDNEIKAAAFPANAPNSGGSLGNAIVTLLGRDKNGNEVSVDFSTPLRFATSGTPLPVPSPSPSASPATTP